MSISSYYEERDKLIAEQKEERELLLACGVATEDIDKLHYDGYKAWKADRIYALHNTISAEELGDEVLSLVWLRRNPCNASDEEIGSFLDSIENEKLLIALHQLNPDDLALVEACLVKGIPQNEYARKIGRAPSSVNEKLKRLKKWLCKKIK